MHENVLNYKKYNIYLNLKYFQPIQSFLSYEFSSLSENKSAKHDKMFVCELKSNCLNLLYKVYHLTTNIFDRNCLSQFILEGK